MIDIILNLIPPIIFGSTHAFPGLVKRPPTRSIVSFLPQFSMFSFMIIQIGVYVIAYEYFLMQPWYEPFVYNRDKTHFPEPSHSGTAILTVNMMSYVIAAVIFSPGPPYRKSFYSNKLYLGVVIVEFVLVSYLTVYPSPAFARFVNLKPSPHIEYHLVLHTLSLANFIISYTWEVFFIQGFLFEYVVPFLRRLRGPIHKYEKLHQQLDTNDKWPPVGRYEVAILGDDESDAAISRQSSHRFNWSRRSSELKHSLMVGLKLAKTAESVMEEPPQEPMTFVTFKDGRHRLKQDSNGQDFV